MASRPMNSLTEDRTEPRDEVLHRTRAVLVDNRQFPVTLVNISPHGLMLRSDAPVGAGEWIKVALPVVGDVHAAVRWALGGRIGCQLDREIAAADYPAVLSAMRD